MVKSAVFIGDESLLVQCAEHWLRGGHRIVSVVTSDVHVADWAKGKDIAVATPGKDLGARLAGEFDLLFSVANLRMLAPDVLSRARLAAINFHDGPLPRYAGLNAPVWALIAGEPEHGVTWHLMTEGADEGNLLVQRHFSIEAGDTALTLNARCYEAAAETFPEIIALVEAGNLTGQAQPAQGRTYFAREARPAHFGALDFEQSAAVLLRLIRALDFGKYYNPVAWPKLLLPSGPVYIEAAELASEVELPSTGAAPGTLLQTSEDRLVIATRDEPISITRLRCAQGRALRIAELVAAQHLQVGQSLRLTEADQQCLQRAQKQSRHDAVWAPRLRSAEPTPAPLARQQPAAPDAPPHEFKLRTEGASQAEIVATFGLWLGRLLGKTEVWCQARCAEPEGKLMGQLIQSDVPMRLAHGPSEAFEALVTNAEGELTRLRERGVFARDLIGRVGVAPAASWPVSVSLRADREPLGESLLRLELGEAQASSATVLRLCPKAYDRATGQEIVSQLEFLLQSGRANSKAPHRALSLLSPALHDRVVRQFNATQKAPPSQSGFTAFADFERRAQAAPDATALISGAVSVTYGQLNERVNQLAALLLAQGAQAQQLVGIFLPRSVDLVVAVLATLKAGCAYLPLDPSYPAERLKYMLEDSGARWVLSSSALLSELPGAATAIAVDQDARLPSQSRANPGAPIKPEQLAYVIYTSGSTGKPKGVLIEHRNVTNFFLGMDERVPRFEKNTWLAVTSLSFDISVLELLWTLARGFRVVLAPESRAELSQQVIEGGLDLDMSLYYFASDEGQVGAEKYRLLLEGARFADEQGFCAVWTPERHFGAFGGLYPNPALTSAAVAVSTKRVKIRAGSCVLPLHEPARVAEEWSVVDNLSGGRVGVSFAAGWHPNDFLLKPESFADRKNVMLRDLEVVRKLWAGEAVQFDSPTGPVSIKTWPRPVQAELPVWLTAAGNVDTFIAAARAKAGVLTHLLGQTFDELQGKIAAYRREWARLGHPGTGHIVLMLHTYVGDSDAQAKEMVRRPMKQYLSSALALIGPHAWSFPAFKRSANPKASLEDNFSALSPEDMDGLLDYSFERYYETAGLFGSIERCQETLRLVSAIGADEVACLIDFGVPLEHALGQLPRLAELRLRATQPPRLAADDFSLAAQLVRHDVTHLQCTPSMVRMLLTNEGSKSALVKLKTWMIGGEALPPSLVAEIHRASPAEILNMYGPTETTVWSCTDRVSGREITLGTPIANTEVYVLDGEQRLLPPGAEGELYIGGLGVARGYHGRPELTQQRFIKDPFSGRPGGRLYRTGDVVRFRSDGRLEFIGRADDQVKIRGYRIELGEIEAQISAFPDIRQAVVVARQDTPGDVRLVAYYRVAEGATAPPEHALRDHLSSRLPEYMVPAHFMHVQKFPLTPNAKVDRKALPPPTAAKAREIAAFAAPTSELEGAIAKVFAEVLGIDRLSATDNFFEAGGHSLLAVRAHRDLVDKLSLKLSITDLFRYPSARALRDHLEGTPAQSERDIVARAEARRQGADRRGALRRARQG